MDTPRVRRPDPRQSRSLSRKPHRATEGFSVLSSWFDRSMLPVARSAGERRDSPAASFYHSRPSNSNPRPFSSKNLLDFPRRQVHNVASDECPPLRLPMPSASPSHPAQSPLAVRLIRGTRSCGAGFMVARTKNTPRPKASRLPAIGGMGKPGEPAGLKNRFFSTGFPQPLNHTRDIANDASCAAGTTIQSVSSFV